MPTRSVPPVPALPVSVATGEHVSPASPGLALPSLGACWTPPQAARSSPMVVSGRE